MRLENKDVDMIKGVITQLLDEFKGELLCNIRERDSKQLWSARDVMAEFDICKKTVSNWANKGILNPLCVGHSVYYKKEDIDAIKN